MTSPKVFITGITGFTEGDVLYEVSNAHPNWSIPCLIRDSIREAAIKKDYPSLNLVHGDLENHKIIYNEAKRVDIILHFANSADYISAALSIQAGIAARETPGYWIHTSGTGTLFFRDVDKGVYRERSEETWDDVRDIEEINNIPSHDLHRDVDAIVFSARERNSNIKSAIVCPPHVYGTGRGPGKTKSTSLPAMIKLMSARGRGFKVGAGNNTWPDVHVQDLSKLYLALIEATVEEKTTVEWGRRGYFFAAAGSHQPGTLAASITAIACELGYIDSDEVDSLDPSEVNDLFQYGAMMWRTYSRSKASRAKEQLEWRPKTPRIDAEEMLIEAVQTELSPV